MGSINIEAVNIAIHRAKQYVIGARTRDGFLLQAGGSITRMSTCFGILFSSMLKDDILRDVLFRDILRREVNRIGDALVEQYETDSLLHPTEYLREQTAYFCLRAIESAGDRIDITADKISNYCIDSQMIRPWLEQLDWSDPWLESNRIMFQLAFFGCRSGDREAANAVDAILSFLEETQENDSGFWGTRSGASSMRAMAGAYHIIGHLIYNQREVRYLETMLDTILSLQSDDGLFLFTGGGNTCLDMDAIDLLCTIYPALDGSKKKKIDSSLSKATTSLLELQRQDGSFPESRSVQDRKNAIGMLSNDRVEQVWMGEDRMRYSSWKLMEYDAVTGDIWSTLCRIVSLVRVGYLYGAGDSLDFSLIPTPGIGQLITCR